MPARSAKQNTALAWYCKTNDLIPQLSARPIYRLKHRDSGEIEEVNIVSITVAYEGREKRRKREQKEGA